MTGIERLRELAGTLRENIGDMRLNSSSGPLWRIIADIADQIAREHAEDCFRMGERAAEDAEAVAWVRDHGGLNAVKVTENVRLNYRDALNGVCERLGLTDGTGMPDMPEAILTELDRRLMPEGMEWLVEAWPRFEDDSPLGLGDEVMTSDGVVKAEELCLTICDKDGGVTSIDFGERVRRPAPKRLDADGAEVEVGADLYTVEGMLKFHVSAIDKKGGRIATEAMFALDKWADPKMYTHRAPVLAADGKPLREGETVWGVNGATYRVTGLHDGEVFARHVGGSFGAEVESAGGSGLYRLRADKLTHERPRQLGAAGG